MPEVSYGDIDDVSLPLAILVHGFPDTPFTWRHLGPALVAAGYRVSAPWLPGYATPTDRPLSAGSYVTHVLAERSARHGDERSILIGHDWGAVAGYGAVSTDPAAFRRFVALAVPPTGALGSAIFSYRQLKRAFYVYFIQQVGLAEAVLLESGFWESLWADWSPGYDATADISTLRRHVGPDTIAGVVGPYRASFNPDFADPDAAAETTATLTAPPVPTLCMHGSQDGAIGAELLTDVEAHLPTGSTFELIDGVGHFLHLERPTLIAAAICDWLARG